MKIPGTMGLTAILVSGAYGNDSTHTFHEQCLKKSIAKLLLCLLRVILRLFLKSVLIMNWNIFGTLSRSRK